MSLKSRISGMNAIFVLLISVATASAFTVSGTVVTTQNKPLSGVKVYANPDSSQFDVTDNLGRFKLEGITLPIHLSGSNQRLPGLANNRFMLPGKAPIQAMISFFDLKGRPVHSLSRLLHPGENLLDLGAALPSGSYTLQLSGEGLHFRTRVEFDGRNIKAMGKPSFSDSPQSALAKRSASATLVAARKYYHSGTKAATDGTTDIVITLEKLPNVVLLLSDDQSWTDYGFMGHPHIKTPKLDKLASESMTFSRGYSPTSLCRPALMTLATGLYAFQHGITGNDPAPGTNRDLMLKYIDKATTLQEILHKQKGYTTLQTGKWWEGSWQRGKFTSGMTKGSRHGDDGLKIGREGMAPIKTFIDTTGERPFYVWYAPFLPHTPHNPPQRLLNKYTPLTPSLNVAKYWAMVEWFDETCGELLKILDDKGVRENTLVIYTTDNGWVQEANGTQYDPVSKRAPYDLGTRTPFIVNWPGKVKPLRDDSTLVSNIDFMPTVLAAAGISAPAGLPGVDLLDPAQPAGKRERIFGDIYKHDAADINDPIKTLVHRWVIEGRWKLILTGPAAPDHAGVVSNNVELFDILADPYEKKNLAGQNAAQVSQLKARVDAWLPVK